MIYFYFYKLYTLFKGFYCDGAEVKGNRCDRRLCKCQIQQLDKKMPRKQTLVHRRGLDIIKQEPVEITTNSQVVNIAAAFSHLSPPRNRSSDFGSATRTIKTETGVCTPQPSTYSPLSSRPTLGRPQVCVSWLVVSDVTESDCQ